MIREKTLKILEYPAIIDRLAGFASTETGRALCHSLVPHPSYEDSLEALAETEDALSRLLKYGELPFSGINDLVPMVRHAAAGAVLECSDFFRMAAFLRAVERMVGQIPEEGEEALLIHRKIRQLEPLPGFRRRLEQSVKDEDDLLDQASDALHRIRVSLRETQAAVRRELEKVLARQGEALQENIITLRGGRYVVPVRSDRRAAVRGIVHDRSSTGSTLFIEPMAVVELNNKIRELEAEEAHEIREILKELSAIVAKQADVFIKNSHLLAELDFVMAKAKLAGQMDGSKPLMNEKGVILLRKARHPLIGRDRVVPIDFELGRTFRTLVITGPNTGGKTVSLKTCGLLTLMGMAGLFIPAAAGSELAWFRAVEADIGDEQSIEQNLSTFSSHMKEIIRITAQAAPGMLVLLDELGAGTDPSEGAALAIAILDYLKASGCHTVATTHYRELKGYAMTEPDVENACCEFDTDTLQPTYKLLIGVPGVSNAFAISSRLGLSPAIIDAARALISEEGTHFEDLVSAIEQSHKEARAMEEEVESLREETNRVRDKLALEREKFDREGKKILEEARLEATALLDRAREDVDKLLGDLRSARQADRDSDHRLASEARGRLGAIGRKFQVRRQDESTGGPVRPEEISLGDAYDTVSLGVSGLVRELPDARNQVVLESGSFRVKVPVHELRHAGRKPGRDRKKSAALADHSSALRSEIVMRTGTELMLLGKRVDEALTMLDHFLDEAVLAGISPVRIVHGKGTGALRKATREALSRDRRVRSFRQGADGEGGDGVTVAELILS
ncbi:MAG TPA: endonuclease MutS2 [Bacillota bacterium]|jgi:DNA mismatch repair protein MutS2|nr:endonuclease MutS2 [Fastidiosipila sp.]HPX92873.1 endonuclease MutS2 [Bacillota bacterium]HQB80737.1 endonuclease MutS2 [Bacillota bacterium]